MLAFVRSHLREFIVRPPGRRFQDIHMQREMANRRTPVIMRYVIMGIGTLMVVAGVFFLAVPGPGSLLIIIGFAVVAGQSMAVARFLDWMELKLRPAFFRARSFLRGLSVTQRVAIIACAAMLAVMAGYAFYVLLVR